MSEMLRPAEIAVIWQTYLNDKAVELYDLEVIDDKLYFNVTADYQMYERLQKGEYELDDYQDFTPVIISRVNHYEYPADYLRYEETYNIEVYGYADQLESLEKVFKAFTVDENTANKSVLISPFRITKQQEDISFGEETEPLDGSNRARVRGTGSFEWSFLDGIMTSYDTIISIDDEEMPYITYDWAGTFANIMSEAITDEGRTSSIIGNSYFQITLLLPYISTSTVIKNLYREFYAGIYNKKHKFSYYDTALDETFTFDVKLTNVGSEDTQPKILDFAITLERVYPTVDITIDTVPVPVKSFEINSRAEVDSSTQINSDTSDATFLGNSYQITMSLDISDISNTKTQELLNSVLQQSFQTPHLINITKGTLSAQYDVLLINGSYSFDLNPIEKIDLVFVKRDDNV